MKINKNQYFVISTSLMILWYILLIFIIFIQESYEKFPIWYIVGSYVIDINAMLFIVYCFFTIND